MAGKGEDVAIRVTGYRSMLSGGGEKGLADAELCFVYELFVGEFGFDGFWIFQLCATAFYDGADDAKGFLRVGGGDEEAVLFEEENGGLLAVAVFIIGDESGDFFREGEAGVGIGDP